MPFIRKKKRGMDRRTMKVWFSECNNYKIVWTNECRGVSVAPHFHAMVREYAGEDKIWNFAGRRGPYRKLNAAIAACEYHQKVWRAAIQIASGEFKGRADRLRSLDARARVGTGVNRNRLFSGQPVWVRSEGAEAHRTLHAALFGKDKCKFDDQDDPSEISKPSESSTPEGPTSGSTTSTTPDGGPVSNAVVEGEFDTPPTETSSKATSSRRGTRAKRAKAPAPEPEKKASKRTRKSSKSTKSNSTDTGEPMPSGSRRSKNSPAKKSKRSKSSASTSEE